MEIQRKAKVVYRKIKKIIFGNTIFALSTGYAIGLWVSILLILIKEYFNL
jgi:hypothetical protein